jgi:hypothetical protein
VTTPARPHHPTTVPPPTGSLATSPGYESTSAKTATTTSSQPKTESTSHWSANRPQRAAARTARLDWCRLRELPLQKPAQAKFARERELVPQWWKQLMNRRNHDISIWRLSTSTCPQRRSAYQRKLLFCNPSDNSPTRRNNADRMANRTTDSGELGSSGVIVAVDRPDRYAGRLRVGDFSTPLSSWHEDNVQRLPELLDGCSRLSFINLAVV